MQLQTISHIDNDGNNLDNHQKLFSIDIEERYTIEMLAITHERYI